MINILIPMAGLGSRFAKAGYKKPKPFIDVSGKPMIVRVLENLKYPDAKYILVAQWDHLQKEKELVKKIEHEFNAVFVPIEKLSEGTACTVLYARKFINNSVPLLIANSDQIVDIDIAAFKDPKWSFAKIDDNGLVKEVKEKEVISPYATVGIYLYSKGSDFVNSAVDMIARNDRVNNEFYTCPTYNYAIKDGLKIGIYNIHFNQMHGIGTPEDLNSYLKIIQ